ncbi:MAG TPA: hypothetical protein VJT31_23790 [Rugosimonospora sp.]|nr:hypothetical protein [Rugosimonospora sp.]
MQPPPPGPYPGAAPAANDRSTLFGVLGLVIGLLCCSPAGIVLGVLSIQQSNKSGKPATLGYVAVVVSVVALIGGIIYAVAIRK